MKYYHFLTVLIMPFCSYILLQKIIIDKYFNIGLINKEELELLDFFKLFLIGYSPFILYLYFLKLTSLKSILGIFILLTVFIYSVYSGAKFFNQFLFQSSVINAKKPEINSIINGRDKMIVYVIYTLVYLLLSYVLII